MVKGITAFLFALVVSLIFPVNSFAAGMTRSDVSDVLSQLMMAKNTQNMNTLNQLLASNIKVTLDLPDDMGGKVNLSKKEYQSKIQRIWRLPADYHYDSRDVNIIVIGTGERAIVTSSMTETLSLQGTRISSTTLKQRMMVVLENNHPVITEIYSVLP